MLISKWEDEFQTWDMIRVLITLSLQTKHVNFMNHALLVTFSSRQVEATVVEF